jgi:glutamyl-Q tRNA(Asp) synthetase
MSAILRFAPSPNGWLHLGHAFSALFTRRAATALGGTALLRIEDIDPARCKPEFDAGLQEDLHWLGLDWPEPVLRQSARMDRYRAAAVQLGDLLYPCDCTRTEIAARASHGVDPDGTPLYDGKCHRHGVAGGRPVQMRLDMTRAIERAGGLTITALPVAGIHVDFAHPQLRPADPARWGDAVIVRKDAPTSYHLSVVVDDAAQGVTHVTRGKDLEAATDLHVLLQRLLGLASPAYAHHDLIRDTDREKLSKSKGSTSLRDLRAAGWTPEDARTRLGFEP